MRRPSSSKSEALKLAGLASVVGGLFAAVSLYWGLGGTWLLDTIGGALEEQGRAGTARVMTAVWAAVILKSIAAVLPLVALRGLANPRWNRTLWVLAWLEAGLLTIYGLVLTSVGLLVQAGVITATPPVNHRALAWHAYLWDPWYLVWGLIVSSALVRGRRRSEPTRRQRRTEDEDAAGHGQGASGVPTQPAPA